MRALRQGFIALHYRNYRLLWTGQLISVTGTWMQTLAQAWLVYEVLGASAFQLGLVNVLQFLPVLLFGIPSGILADRFPKRALMMVTQTVMMLLAATTAVLVFTDLIQLWHVFLIATVFGIANAVDMPTRQAFVSELVDRDALMNAIALNSALFNTGRIVGPAIAGVLLALFGPGALFAINAASYIAVLTGLALMRVAPLTRDHTDSALHRLRDGLRYVRATPLIFRTIVMVGTIGIFGMNFNVWVPLLAAEDFGAGAGTYGALMSAMGIGALSGALSLAVFGRRPSRGRMLISATSLGAAELILGLIASIPGPVVVAMIALAAAGFCMSTTSAMANTIVQTTAPDALRGRVMAVYTTIFSGTAPVGALLTGAIAERFSAAVAVGFGGFVASVAALLIASVQRRRQTEREQRMA